MIQKSQHSALDQNNLRKNNDVLGCTESHWGILSQHSFFTFASDDKSH